MSEKVFSLDAARSAKSDRERAMIEKCAGEFQERMLRRIDWLFLPAETRAEVADSLASDIAIRYQPIALQFRNALHDGLLLYLAAGMERGEDPGLALVRGLAIMLGFDERFIKITGHLIRETSIMQLPIEAHAGFRESLPSPVDQVRADLVTTFASMGKKS